MILTIFGILSPAIAAALCYFTPLNWWLCAPVALGVFLTLNILMILLELFVTIFFKRGMGGKPSGFCRFVIIHMMDWFYSLANISVKLEGEEQIPKEPCLLICNHISLFDATTAVKALRMRKLSIVAKESVFRIPLIAPYIRRCSFLSLDRSNPRKGLATLKNASKLMTEYGMDVLIYPEGTRSLDGELLPFKEGAFMVAKWAKAPIVVMQVEGTNVVKKKAPFRRTKITLRVVGVINQSTVDETRVTPLCEMAREMMIHSKS
jgi:1-acyl-sn-glycerol-3-phosphate acyltransferase